MVSTLKPILFGLTIVLCLGAPAMAQDTDLTAVTAAAKQDRATLLSSQTECEAGDAAACYTMGDFYRMGRGTLQDYGLAMQAYDQACEAKYAAGCAGLAYLYNYGRGADQDLVKARSLYKTGCDLGERSACAAYGNMLFAGKGGRKNTVEGGRLLRDVCLSDDASINKWACERTVAIGAYDRGGEANNKLNRLNRLN